MPDEHADIMSNQLIPFPTLRRSGKQFLSVQCLLNCQRAANVSRFNRVFKQCKLTKQNLCQQLMTQKGKCGTIRRPPLFCAKCENKEGFSVALFCYAKGALTGNREWRPDDGGLVIVGRGCIRGDVLGICNLGKCLELDMAIHEPDIAATLMSRGKARCVCLQPAAAVLRNAGEPLWRFISTHTFFGKQNHVGGGAVGIGGTACEFHTVKFQRRGTALTEFGIIRVTNEEWLGYCNTTIIRSRAIIEIQTIRGDDIRGFFKLRSGGAGANPQAVHAARRQRRSAGQSGCLLQGVIGRC